MGGGYVRDIVFQAEEVAQAQGAYPISNRQPPAGQSVWLKNR